MIENNENFDDNSILPLFLKAQNDPARRQVQSCYNLIVNFFEKGNNPSKQEFTEVKIKRQILDHYLKDICNIISYYGLFTIKIVITKIKSHKTPNTNKRFRYRILKSFYRLKKRIYNTKIHKEKIQYSETMYFQSCIAIYPY